jgi:hypothetical protein
MKKFLVKVELWKKSVPVKIELGRTVHKSMTGNANFPSPIPPLAALAAAVQELETAYEARMSHGGGTLFTSVIHEKENVFDEMMRDLERYVNIESRNEESVIRSAGMDVRKPRGKAEVPGIASSFSAKPGQHPGSVDLRWKRPAWAITHLIFMTDDIDNSASWKLTGATTNTRFTVTGLEPLRKYWFRIEAVGSAGTGPPADVVMTYAAT